MSDNKQEKINQLFAKVMTMATVDAYRYLDQLDEDEEIVAEVAQFLSDEEARTTFLQQNPQLTAILETNSSEDLVGQSVKNLKFLKQLGTGGMGEVYLAEDTQLHRKVAVKTIRSKHLMNPELKQRFRREALLLSKMDHPNICKIYSLLETEDTDFLVLEFIQGQTLNALDYKQLSSKQKIKLSKYLAQALISAHQQNIVHRDLKPDNIMLTDTGEIKILDFGISRSLTDSTQIDVINPNSDDHGFYGYSTIPGSIMGTLGYMCPEQANGEDITTASDIYSLGVVLQELMTEAPAHPKDSSFKDLMKRAKTAQTEPMDGLSSDWKQLLQLMLSLAPSNRPTARGVLESLQKIENKPRRRLQLSAVIALVVIAVLAVSKYTLDLKHEKEQADLARQQAEQVSELLAGIFNSSNTYNTGGKDLTAKDMLDEGAKRIDKELASQPLVHYKLKSIIGSVYNHLAEYDISRKHLEGAIQIIREHNIDTPEDMARIYKNLAKTVFDQGHFEESKEILNQALNSLNDIDSDPLRLQILYQIAATESNQGHLKVAEKLLQDLLKNQPQVRTDSQLLTDIHNSLGLIYWKNESYEKANDHMQWALVESRKTENNDEKIATLLSNQANILGHLGRMQESSQKATESVRLREKYLGEDHPDLALSYDNLALVYYRMDDMQGAADWNLKALEIYEKALGRDHQDFAMTLANRSVLLRNAKDYEGSEKALREVLDTFRKTLGDEHYYIADYEGDLGKLFVLQEKYQQALPWLQSAVALSVKLQRPLTHSNRFGKTWKALAETHQSLGDNESYNKIMREILAYNLQQETMDEELTEDIQTLLNSEN